MTNINYLLDRHSRGYRRNYPPMY